MTKKGAKRGDNSSPPTAFEPEDEKSVFKFGSPKLVMDVRKLAFKIASMHSINAGLGWVIKMGSSRDAKAAVGEPVTVRGVTLNIAQYHSEDPTLAWLDD